MVSLSNVPQSLGTPSSSQEVVTFNTPAGPFHFDSPDPSPAESTQILPPFSFVAHHDTMINPKFSGFHFAPAPREGSAATQSFDDLIVPAGDFASLYQQNSHDSTSKPEIPFESHKWATDQIDDITQSRQNRSSFEYDSQQPNSFIKYLN
jgi:hypothetical protein